MLRFVLLRGVLAYGLMLFVVMMLVISRGDVAPRAIVVAGVLSVLGGAAFGALTWIFMEWVYRKFTPGIRL